MDKARVEAFSDGVFAIVITLLIFDIKAPELISATNADLWVALVRLIPSIVMYFVTFTVVSVLWINHHFLFHSFAKTVDRQLNLLNMSYLMFGAFLPFSANILGLHHTLQPAALLYGINICIISLLSVAMVRYVLAHSEILNHSLSRRIVKQSRIRTSVSAVFAIAGLLTTFLWTPLAIFLYAFPVIFNIIPGTLDLTEKIFGFTLE